MRVTAHAHTTTLRLLRAHYYQLLHVRVKVLKKMYSMDMSTFELKFKKRGQAQKLAHRNTRIAVGWVDRALGLFSDFGELYTTLLLLLARNKRLLGIMLISW